MSRNTVKNRDNEHVTSTDAIVLATFVACLLAPLVDLPWWAPLASLGAISVMAYAFSGILDKLS